MLKKLIPPRWLLYLLYGICLTAALLYIRFPAGKVEAFLLRKVEAAVPGSKCSYQSASYRFPITAVIDEVQFIGKKDGKQRFLIDSLTLSPVVTGFGRDFMFRSSLYEGEAEGRLRVLPLKKGFTLTDVRIREANIEKIGYLQTLFRRDVKGLFSGSGEYEGYWVAGKSESGRGQFTLQDGSMLLRQPILTVRKMDFEQLEMDFAFSGDTITLSAGTMKGSPLLADFAGGLTVKEESSSWQVDLKGNMRVDKAFVKEKPHLQRAYKRMVKQYGKGDALPFMISGSAQSPRFRFGGE